MKFLLAALMMTQLHLEMVALHNGYHTLHDQGVYGIELQCDPVNEPFYRCTNEAQTLRMYCPSLPGYQCKVFKAPVKASEADSAGL